MSAVDRSIILVTEDVAPAAVEALQDDFTVRRCDGTDQDQLSELIRDAAAVIVRGGTRIDAEMIASAPELRVIARAGVGLEKIDVDAATQSGVMVVNAPVSNLVSAAEHAVGLLLSVARRIAAADATLRSGRWERSAFEGVELHEKTLGVLGLGRVGMLVAKRLAAFGMDVVAHDPYVQPGRAAKLGVRLVSLDQLLAESDVITVHLPRTPETVGLLGPSEFARMKSGVLVVNSSRGGVVDEKALYVALQEGKVFGAGIDVFDVEPGVDSPLLELPNVVATPHIGANTVEAQEKAGRAVARSVRLALAGELVPDAVNVQGGVIAESVRPAIGLTERLGRLFTAIAGEVAQQLDIDVRGEIAMHDVKVLELAALKGAFADVFEDQLSYVNAPLLANDRGMEVRLVSEPDSPDFRNLVTVRGVLRDNRQISVSGTLIGPKHAERIVEIEGFHLEIEPASHMVVLRFSDRPGVIGLIGRILGDRGVNIESMQVSRDRQQGLALVVLTVDAAIPQAALDELGDRVGAVSVRAVNLS